MRASTFAHAARGRWRADAVSADADHLLVDELVRAEASELATGARALDAAEGQLRAVGAHHVDEDHAGLDAVGDAHGLVRIRREHVGAAVYRVGSEDEAITLANDTPFGLGSYVFTTDAEQAMRVADRIEAGMVFVNVVGADSPELPFGGVKRSGSGRELGRFGADEFVNKKMIRIG